MPDAATGMMPAAQSAPSCMRAKAVCSFELLLRHELHVFAPMQFNSKQADSAVVQHAQ